MSGKGTLQKGSPREAQQFQPPARSADKASKKPAPSSHTQNNKPTVTEDGAQQEPVDSVRAQAVPTPRPGSYAPPPAGFAARQDGWSRPLPRQGSNYSFSPLGMYGHSFGSESMMDYEQSVYGPYPMMPGQPSPGQRRAVNEARRGDVRFNSLFGMNNMGGLPDSRSGAMMGKMPRMGMHALNLQGSMPGLPSTTAAWYERSAASYEKSKEIFDYMSKRCDANDCTHVDQEKLVTVTKERTVRQLDFNAASQAMNALVIAEKKWSTEPNGEGFRTYAKDIRGLVEQNSIDAMRIMYPMSEDSGPQCEAQSIAETVEEAGRRAAFMKEYAENTAQAYGIPLNTPADTFLECAEQYYLSENSEGTYMVPSPGTEAHLGRLRDFSQTFSGYFPRHEYVKNGLPKAETSLAQFAKAIMPKENGTEMGGKFLQTQGWKTKPAPINTNILMKERQPQASAMSFDVRSSQWWNPTQDGFSPKVNSFGQPGNPVWGINDDLFQSGFQDGLEELTSGAPKEFNPIMQNNTEKTSSSKGLERPTPKKQLDCEQDTCGQPTNMGAPLCYCGHPCAKKCNSQGIFWGCASCACEAQIPIIQGKVVEKSRNTILKHQKTKRGRETQPPQKFAADETTSKTCINDESQRDGPQKQKASKAAVTSSVPNKVPNSLDSSGIKESGTTYRVNSESLPFQACKRKGFCAKPAGHRGVCSKGGPRRPVGRPRKKAKVQNGAEDPGAILSMDKGVPLPHEELILSRPENPSNGDPRNSKSSQATESIRKAVEKMEDAGKHGSSKNGKNLEVTSKWADETNNVRSSHDAVSNESDPDYTEGQSGDQITAPKGKQQPEDYTSLMIEAIKKEREAIPSELRCVRKPTCLNIRGHRGRCRLRPGGFPSKKRKGSSKFDPEALIEMLTKQTSPESLNEEDEKKVPETGAKRGLDPEPVSKPSDLPVVLTSNSNEAADMKARIPEEDATLSEREVQKSRDGNSGKELADSAKENVFTTPDQAPLLKQNVSCEEKEGLVVAAQYSPEKFLDRNALLRWEFENLSSEYIRTFYGCSQTFPASEWKAQKDSYLNQCSILAAKPPLSIEAGGEQAKKSKLAACKDVPASSEWVNIVSLDAALYKEDRSSIHGCGLFAVTDIASGTPITELVGEFIPRQDAKKRESVYADSPVKIKNCIGITKGTIDHAKHMLFDINRDWSLDATKAGSMAKFVNHSCMPNCEVRLLADTQGLPHLVIHACTNIKEGEELTCDYKLLSGGFSCHCKSDKCRKSI